MKKEKPEAPVHGGNHWEAFRVGSGASGFNRKKLMEALTKERPRSTTEKRSGRAEAPKGRTVTVRINSRPVTVSSEATVLDAAKAAGIYIPAVCGHPDIGPSPCALCAISIEETKEHQSKDLQMACTTPVGEGMVVVSETSRIRSWRRRQLKRIAVEYRNPCLDCPRLDLCDSTVCGRRHLPADRRCATCDQQKTCELRKAARHIFTEKRSDLAGDVDAIIRYAEIRA